MLSALLIVVVGVLAIAATVRAGSKFCPDSVDGEHEDIRVTTPDGMRLQCIRCARLTKGIDAFARKV